MPTKIKPGDWITSFSTGLWQVYRVEQYRRLDPVSGKPENATTVFSKRLLNSKLKRAFAQECCAAHHVTKLTKGATAEIAGLLKNDEKLAVAFAEFQPKPIDAVYNARISLPHDQTPAAAARAIQRTPFTEIELKAELRRLGLYDAAGRRTAQFIAVNHAIRDGWLAYTFAKIL